MYKAGDIPIGGVMRWSGSGPLKCERWKENNDRSLESALTNVNICKTTSQMVAYSQPVTEHILSSGLQRMCEFYDS